MNRRTFSKLTAAAICSTRAFAQPLASSPGGTATKGSLTANLSSNGVVFNPMIFGQFLEHFHRQVYGGVFDPGSPLSNGMGFRMDVVEALRELQVPIVRWPGGCFVSGYHWRDGVGKNRQPSFNKAWGVTDPNTFGTDEYIEWCRLIGAEPYICTNAGTGTEEEMSDWVEYCNLREGRNAQIRIDNGHPDPYRVKYWSIGNENYFSTEIGSKTIEQWGPLVRVSAQLMRAVDPTLQLLAAANTDSAWTTPMLKAAGSSLNYISIHGYWDALWERGTHPSGYLQCMARSQQPEHQMEQAIGLLQANGFADKIKIAFDEWNLRSWHHPGFPGGGADRQDLLLERDENDRNETYTMADALFSASFLHSCLRNAGYVQMACMAPIVNVRGPLFVHPRGLVKRTTFHVMQMYRALLLPEVVDTEVSGETLQVGKQTVPVLDAVTTRSKGGRRVAISMINRDPSRSALWTINLTGHKFVGDIDLTVLAGDSPDAYNDVTHPDRVTPFQKTIPSHESSILVPAHSIVIARFAVDIPSAR